MATFKISSAEEHFTNISNSFIRYYMSDANGEFVKLYLYLAYLHSSKRDFSISSIADHLNCTEKDVKRGIGYWIARNVISLSYNAKHEVNGLILQQLEKPGDSSEYNIIDFEISGFDDSNTVLKGMTSKQIEGKQPEVSTDFSIEFSSDFSNGLSTDVSTISNTESADKQSSEMRPLPKKEAPSMDALNNRVFANLINEANAYCGKPISQANITDLFYIYDTLGFSFDLCEYLLEYCAEVKKTNFRYIVAVASNWYQEGITTRDEACEYSSRYYGIYRKILKALGISNRYTPAPSEKDFIDSWVKELKFSEAIILEACRRAIDRKPNSVTFAYVNGILKDWYAKDVHRLDDILKLDEAYQKENGAKKSYTRDNTGKQSPAKDNSVFPQSDLSDQLQAIEDLYLQGAKKKDD